MKTLTIDSYKGQSNGSRSNSTRIYLPATARAAFDRDEVTITCNIDRSIKIQSIDVESNKFTKISASNQIAMGFNEELNGVYEYEQIDNGLILYKL